MGNQADLDALARKQHGAFNRSQAAQAGFDRNATFRAVASGRWIRLDHSVFAVASSRPTWERQLSASILSRPKAVVGHRSAAHLLGLEGARKARPTIIVPEGSNTRSALARIIESDQFDSLATTTVRGFRVTTSPETFLSLAADVPVEELEPMFDDAVLGGNVDLQSVLVILDREAGRRTRGIKLMRRLVRERLPSAPTKDSTHLEALLERILRQTSAPAWTREHPLQLLGRQARVDVYIPAWLLVVEADGRNWHLRRGDFERDRRRDNDLATRGLQVLRYTYRMLVGEPERCIAEIERVGAIRAAPRSA